MEDIENRYIVKLLTGAVTAGDRFLVKDENNIKYGASSHVHGFYQNIFNDFEEHGNEKFAVIIDEEGAGDWQGTTFRNIQFISSREEFCKEFQFLTTRKDKILYDRMARTETLLDMLLSNQDPLKIERLKNEIFKLEEELSVIEKRLKELNQNNL